MTLRSSRRRAMQAALATAAAVMLPGSRTAAQHATPSPASTGTPVAAGDFSGLVDIGGRSLYLECRGSGSPTVILEAGFRSRADYWTDDLIQPNEPRTMVFEGVAAFTRVCAYDRPGTTTVTDGGLQPSRSDPVSMPDDDRD